MIADPDRLQDFRAVLKTDPTVYDLGNLVARGQEITHEFTIENPTDREVHVLGSDALTPCCSSILELPATIAARSQGKMKVSFRPGFQSGRKGVRFVVATDGGSSVPSRFSLLANLFAEVDVEEGGSTEPDLDLGMPIARNLRIIGRRSGTVGRDAPSILAVDPPSTGRFVGEAREVVLPSGIIESSRDVEILIPPFKALGKQNVNLRARWAGGQVWNHSLTCVVVAPIKVAPAGFVTQSTEPIASKAFLLRSSKIAFRVLKVEGPFAVEDAADSSKPLLVHSVRLVVDPAKVEYGKPLDIRITTDHPHQPTVVASVLVVKQEREGSR